jgi:1-acyl-sn-glycerol-3-phosphate acyltransferase
VTPLDADLEVLAKPDGRPAWPVRILLTGWLLVLLAWLGILSLPWNAVAVVLQPLFGGPRMRQVGRSVISHVYRFYWRCARWSGMMRLEAESLDALRDVPGGVIIAANHPSMLDAMMIVARLPRTVCVMKGALRRNPFLGPGASLAGYVANDHTRTMIRGSVERLQEGCQLVVFPEGTRSPSPRQIHPFSRSIALIAQRAQVPVQAIVIETDSPYLSKGWPLWKLPPLPIVFRARIGERFEPSKDPEELSARMEAYFRGELRS